jgi:hypothetical protein
MASPPVARPLTAKPLGLATATPVQPEATSLAPKLLGAIGLIFGILALATFWLPLLDPLMGWTGIVVGVLGLLLGIAGMVLAAMQKGAGLYLNVAVASSSLVGLVLTIVLGVRFGMFSSPAPPPVAVAPVVVAPQPVAQAPSAVKEPEPAPEPVWTDASEAIEQGPIRARISGLRVENIRLESANFAQMSRGKPQPLLRVRVSIENISPDKIVAVPGWNGGSSLGGGVGDLLQGSELGKQFAAASAGGTLTDDKNNNYPQTPAIRLPAAQADLDANPALRPMETVEKQLVFDPPIGSAEYLRLELPAVGFSGSEPLRFQIPKTMFAPPPEM